MIGFAAVLMLPIAMAAASSLWAPPIAFGVLLLAVAASVTVVSVLWLQRSKIGNLR